MIEKTCKYCGKTFCVKPYRKDIAFYCSRSCFAKANYDKTLRTVDKTYLKGNQFRKGKKPANAFEKGHIPWNKNLKGIHLNEETEFKKGRISDAKLPIGSIVNRKEKGKNRNFIKIADPNIWQYYSIYLYEQKYGKIPNGYVIHHINKISDDDRIENLICVSRAEHIKIHRKDLLSAKGN